MQKKTGIETNSPSMKLVNIDFLYNAWRLVPNMRQMNMKPEKILIAELNVISKHLDSQKNPDVLMISGIFQSNYPLQKHMVSV